MNGNRSSLTSQVKSQKSPRNQSKTGRDLTKPVKYLREGVSSNFYIYIKKELDGDEKRLMNAYLYYRGRKSCPKPSQKDVAKRAGISVSTLKRKKKKLYGKGLIQDNGLNGSTSIINISPMFFREDIKQQLKYILPAITSLPHENILRGLWLYRKNALSTGIIRQFELGIYVYIIYTLKQERQEEKISGRGGEDIVLGAVASHIAKKNRNTCCWDDTVFGKCEHVFSEPRPVSTKRKSEGSPVLGDRDPVDKNQARPAMQGITAGLAAPLRTPSRPVYGDYEELVSRRGLPCRNAFAKNTDSRPANKFTDSHRLVVVSQSSVTRRKGYRPPPYDTSAYKPFYERVKFARERKEYWEINKPSNDEEAVRRNEKALEYQRILGIS